MYRRSPGQRDARPFTSDYGPDPDFLPQWRVSDMHDLPHREGSGNSWGRPREDFTSRPDQRSRSSEKYKGRRSPIEYSHHRSGPDQPSGYSEHRRMSPKSFEEMRRPHSPRQVPREKLPSLLSLDHNLRQPSPGWGRNDHGMDRLHRQEGGLGREARVSRACSPRGREFNRPHDRRQQDRMEAGRSYQEERNQAAYRERSPPFDRSQPKRSDFRDPRPEKRPRDSWSHYEDGPEKPYVRGGAPVVVEHDHGISQRGGGDRGPERHPHAPRHEGPPPDRHRRQDAPRNEPPMALHSKRRRSTPPPASMGQSKRQEPPGGNHNVPHLLQKRQAAPPPPPLLSLDVDLRKNREDRGALAGKKWEQKRPEDDQRRKGPDMGSQMGPYPHRDSGQDKRLNVNREMPGTSRAERQEWETLKIRVDMSRPMGQDSGSLGYNSDRQLSLDLVNVGRQRLDFLPMLEHSGTVRETPLHTGTFAQEIITLVHQVKEMYFKGDNTTLNDRFSSVMTGSPEPEEEPVANRRINVSEPGAESVPLFSKIGNPEAQRRPQAFDPGDLRHDLERRRQERLEGVKITISGASFPPVSKVESEPLIVEQERVGYEDASDWVEEAPEERREWGEQANDMRQRMSWSGRRNRRRPFRSGPQSGPNRRQYHNSANGGSW